MLSIKTLFMAAVMAAVVLTFVMMVSVMIAFCIGIVVEGTQKKTFHLFICVPCYTGIQRDSGCCECRLGTAADTAADKCVYLMFFQKACKSAVTAANCADDFAFFDRLIFNGINFEKFGVSKMLEHLFVIIGYS